VPRRKPEKEGAGPARRRHSAEAGPRSRNAGGAAPLEEELARLRRSEEFYRAIIENQVEFVDRYLPGGILTYVNPALARYVGKRPEELVGTSFLPLMHEEDRAEILERLAALTPERPAVSIENRFVLPGGALRWHRWVHQAFFDELGRVTEYQSVGRDVTEARSAHVALRRNEARLRLAQEIAHIGSWEYDPATGRIWWSDELHRIFGLADPAAPASLEGLLARVHPADRERLRAQIESALPFRSDYRIVRPDGSERIIHEEVQVERSADGRPRLFHGTAQDITERTRAEAALRERERQLAESQRIAHIGSWEHNLRTGQVVWSDELFRLLGLDPARDTADFERFFSMVHPEDQPGLRREIERTLREKTPYSVDYRFILPDGTRRMIHAQAELLRDETGRPVVLSGTAQDVTERAAAEEDLRRSERFVRRILDTVDEGFIVVDADFRILTANRAFCAQVGREPAEVVGRTCHELSHGTDIPCHEAGDACAVHEALRSGEPRVVAHRHTDPEGRRVYVETKAFPVGDSRGRATTAIATITNITERQLLEEERLRAQKLESIGTLAGGIAHDFNNLLQAVFGYLAMAQLTLDRPERARGMLAEAERALHQTVGLTSQLLTFSKGGRPARRTIGLGPVLRDATAFALSGSRCGASVEIAPDLWSVEADAGQIAQVVQNVVLNADQAMSAGGTVRVAARNLRAGDPGLPRDLEARDHVLIEVADSGTGIPEEHLGRIFDPYFTTKPRGSGLGLATSYSIVRGHEGKITVASVAGAGSTFSIFLPASHGPLATGEAAPAPEPPRLARILVMDDEERVREVAGALLGELGHEVALAGSGTEAVGVFRAERAAGRPFDLVILDLTVRGGMGGAEAIRELRAIDPGVRAVLASGYADERLLADHRDAGFAAFLRKPYDLDELRRALHACLA